MSFDAETGRDRYFAELAREVADLVDPATGRLSAEFSRTIDCPLCASADHRPLFEKAGYTFVRCASCTLVFANPQVDEARVVERYRGMRSAELWAEVLLSDRQQELDRQKFAAILDELEPRRGGGRLLDVGCSIGLFLDLARTRGWHGTGIEFGERALQHARDVLGLDVLDVPLEDAGIAAASFDVVTVLSVLEHTTDPRALVREIARILKPGGTLYAITPNVESLACRVLHERAATFDGRNHLVYFSRRTLTDLLEREGFANVETTTHVTSLGPILEWLAYETPYAGSDLDGDPLAAELSGRELEPVFERLGLGYKLHCLARR
jgi:2-polyprenyl-3-methyl-5-hydroxy-6-metoxy-1,4-benzoquinol methylase